MASLRFIGNATVLIEWGPIAILTDPNFVHMHEEVSVAPGITATRLTEPAMEIGQLPPLDLVILSHFHGDHFDQVAEAELDRSVPIVTPPAAASELRSRGFEAIEELRTWDAFELRKGPYRVRVTAVPGRHGPPVVDLVLPDVMGSIVDLESPDGAHRLYISGDTLVFDDLDEIPARFPSIDVGLFHLGGTRVLGLMVTMDGEQGIRAVQIINPAQAIPIHYDDYDLFTSPLSDFIEAVREAGWEDRVTYLERGQSVELPRVPLAHAR
jgi:L-ascorbate metabolism protein UlaG (beta-lactamase superfamily)